MKFDAHQYTIDAGWDFTLVKLTAENGVADEDRRVIRQMAVEQGFGGADADAEADEAADALLASCKARVAEAATMAQTYAWRTDAASGEIEASSPEQAVKKLTAEGEWSKGAEKDGAWLTIFDDRIPVLRIGKMP